MTYQLEFVWNGISEQVRQDAIEFWLQERAVRERQQAALRAEHLLVVAKDEGGRLAAVSTAYKEVLHSFGFSLFLFQLFIGKKHRHLGFAQDVMKYAWQELGKRYARGESRDTLGLVIEVSSEKAMRVRNETVWRDKGMEWVYFGKSPRGRHMRVWYFDDTRIPR